MKKTYRIEQTEHGPAITCLRCDMTSYNRNDINNLYCGKCHEFHDYPTRVPARFDGNALRESYERFKRESRDHSAEALINFLLREKTNL